VGTGERGDVVILDDPHNVKEAESQVVREETVRWFRESMQSRLNNLKESVIVVIMQRVHEGDVSGTIIENYPDYVHLCIPMEYEPDRHCETEIGWTDWRSVEGELAWPERFAAHELRPFKTLQFLWNGQYQQRPHPRGGGILARAGWEYWDKALASRFGRNEGQFPDLDYVVASVDTAYGLRQENDYSACVVIGVWTDIVGGLARPKLIVMSAWKEKLPLHDLVNKIITTCRKLKVDKLLVEAKASGISVGQEIQRLHGEEPWTVQLVNPGNQDKVSRAYSIQALMGEELEGGGRRPGIVYVPCVTDEFGAVLPRAWAETLITSCEHFPKGQHDDDVDAFVMAMRYLRDGGMARRADEIEAQHTRELFEVPRPAIPLYPV
jgi:predicted phage terminase large subunit-like protein